MSVKHVGVYSDEEIEELRALHSNEKVAALVAEAKAVDEASSVEDDDDDLIGDPDEDGDDGVDYSSLKGDELRDLLEKRDLPTTGKNAELVARLEEDDAARTES